MQELTEFVNELAMALGVDPAAVDVDAILALAADAAHTVIRPAAPVAAFVVGLAAGQAGGTPAAISEKFAVAVEQIGRPDR